MNALRMLAHEAATWLIDSTRDEPCAVSAIVDGATWDDATAAVFIVRGGDHVRKLHEQLKSEGLTSDGPIVYRARI